MPSPQLNQAYQDIYTQERRLTTHYGRRRRSITPHLPAVMASRTARLSLLQPLRAGHQRTAADHSRLRRAGGGGRTGLINSQTASGAMSVRTRSGRRSSGGAGCDNARLSDSDGAADRCKLCRRWSIWLGSVLGARGQNEQTSARRSRTRATSFTTHSISRSGKRRMRRHNISNCAMRGLGLGLAPPDKI